jgi:hypothetical protein
MATESDGLAAVDKAAGGPETPPARANLAPVERKRVRAVWDVLLALCVLAGLLDLLVGLSLVGFLDGLGFDGSSFIIIGCLVLLAPIAYAWLLLRLMFFWRRLGAAARLRRLVFALGILATFVPVRGKPLLAWLEPSALSGWEGVDRAYLTGTAIRLRAGADFAAIRAWGRENPGFSRYWLFEAPDSPPWPPCIQALQAKGVRVSREGAEVWIFVNARGLFIGLDMDMVVIVHPEDASPTVNIPQEPVLQTSVFGVGYRTLPMTVQVAPGVAGALIDRRVLFRGD